MRTVGGRRRPGGLFILSPLLSELFPNPEALSILRFQAHVPLVDQGPKMPSTLFRPSWTLMNPRCTIDIAGERSSNHG